MNSHQNLLMQTLEFDHLEIKKSRQEGFPYSKNTKIQKLINNVAVTMKFNKKMTENPKEYFILSLKSFVTVIGPFLNLYFE